MAATWQSVSTDVVVSTSQTTLVPAVPTGLAVGDLMVAFGNCTNSRTITPPAGWTTAFNDVGAGTDDHVYVFTKFATSGDVSAGSFTFTLSSSFSNGIISLHRVSGASANTPTFSAVTGPNSTTQTCPTITTPSANCLMFWGCYVATSSTNSSTADRGTERCDFQNTTGAAWQSDYTNAIVSAGSTTGATITTTIFGAKRLWSLAIESSGGGGSSFISPAQPPILQAVNRASTY